MLFKKGMIGGMGAVAVLTNVSLSRSMLCKAYHTSKTGYYEKAHNFMFFKAVEYIKRKKTSPAKGFPLDEFLPELVWGSWYADHYDYGDGTDDCTWELDLLIADIDVRTYRCDMIHHYGRKRKDLVLDISGWKYGFIPYKIKTNTGNPGDIAAPYYSQVLFDQATKFWPGGVVPELGKLPRRWAGYMEMLGKKTDLGYTWVGADPHSRLEGSPKWPDWATKAYVGGYVPLDPRNWVIQDGPVESKENAMTYLGWAIHLMQDVLVPQNARNLNNNESVELEDGMDEMIKAGKFDHLPLLDGTYGDGVPVFVPSDYKNMEDLTHNAMRKIHIYYRMQAKHEKMMDMAIKITARAIEMFFEEMAWVNGSLKRDGISANPDHCWIKPKRIWQKNIGSSSDCNDSNGVACFEGPRFRDSFGCVYHSECEAIQYRYSGCVVLHNCKKAPPDTICGGTSGRGPNGEVYSSGPVWCGYNYMCEFSSACFAEAAGYNVASECTLSRKHPDTKNNCKVAPENTLCAADSPGPVWCGPNHECKFVSTCFAAASGYDIATECTDCIIDCIQPRQKSWRKVHGPAKDVYAGESKLYVVSKLDGHIYEDAGTYWKDLGGLGCRMFAISGKEIYCLTSQGIKMQPYSGEDSKGRGGNDSDDSEDDGDNSKGDDDDDDFMGDDDDENSKGDEDDAKGGLKGGERGGKGTGGSKSKGRGTGNGKGKSRSKSKSKSKDGSKSKGEDWFLVDGSDVHSNAEFIVAADYVGSVAAMTYSTLPSFCGGFAGVSCDLRYSCIDNPTDNCDPEDGDVDCAGICVASCGGIAGISCDPGYDCIAKPPVGCDPERGVDCLGICVASTGGGIGDDVVAGIYYYDKDSEESVSGRERWVNLAGEASRLTMDKYSGKLYHISTSGGVYKHITGTQWTQIGGEDFKDIYAASDNVYAVHNTTDDIYRYSGSGMVWNKVGGPGYMFAIDRCGKLYGLSPDRSGVYEFTGSGTSWQHIGGPAGKIFAGGCGQFFATNRDTHDLYRYE